MRQISNNNCIHYFFIQFYACFLFVLFQAPAVHAASSTISTQIDVQSTQQPLGVSGVTSSPQTQNIRSSIGLSTDKIGYGLTLDAKLSIDTPDYSSVVLRDNQNQEVRLNPENKNELQMEARLSWSKASHYVSAGYFGHMSSSPYQMRGGFIEYEKSFFEKTTFVGGQLNIFEQKRPQDFFSDRDGFFKERPAAVHGQQFNLYVEQVLNDKWKAKLTASTAKKIEERPRNYGLELKTAYAFTSRVFGILSSAYYQETENEPLLNERGYFKAYVNQLELITEPFYDFFVGVSYGFSAEIENEVRSSNITQVGVDQYGLSLKYIFRNMNVFLNGAVGKSNSLTSSSKISGGLAWML